MCAIAGFNWKNKAFLDLSQKGKQPMRFKNLLIVYNGEVYNFKQLKVDIASMLNSLEKSKLIIDGIKINL